MITGTTPAPEGITGNDTGCLPPESGHVPIRSFPLCSIRPSAENSKLYRPVTKDDPDILALAESIRKHGILEPLLVIRDGYIVSGHRRHCAAQLAGLKEVPCRVLDFCRADDPDR